MLKEEVPSRNRAEKILWMGRDSLSLFGSGNGSKRHDSDRRHDRHVCGGGGDLDAVQGNPMFATSVQNVSDSRLASRLGDSDTATVRDPVLLSCRVNLTPSPHSRLQGFLLHCKDHHSVYLKPQVPHTRLQSLASLQRICSLTCLCPPCLMNPHDPSPFPASRAMIISPSLISFPHLPPMNPMFVINLSKAPHLVAVLNQSAFHPLASTLLPLTIFHPPRLRA